MDNCATSSPDNDWRGESDHRTLQNAAEVMADKIRMAGVLKHRAKAQKAETNMASMLKRYKATGSLK